MKFLDRNYRIFGLINVIDLAVVIAVLLGAAVIARVVFGLGTDADPQLQKTIRIQVVAPRVAAVDAAQFTEGETVRKRDGKPIGTLVEVTIRPGTYEVATADGRLVRTQSSTFKEVILTVEGQGVPTDQGVMIDGARVRQNMQIDVATPRFEAGEARIAVLEIKD